MEQLFVWLLTIVLGYDTEVGPLSVYAPNDGQNAGVLACGGQFTKTQEHIAHRRWRQLKCGRDVLVYAHETGRWKLTKVRDAGPFGIVNAAGDWRVWTKSYTAPPGWRFRGLTDLSWALWQRLGRPSFLSRVRLIFLPAGSAEWLADIARWLEELQKLLRYPQRMPLAAVGRAAVA